jgi:hypothetical protein
VFERNAAHVDKPQQELRARLTRPPLRGQIEARATSGVSVT